MEKEKIEIIINDRTLPNNAYKQWLPYNMKTSYLPLTAFSGRDNDFVSIPPLLIR